MRKSPTSFLSLFVWVASGRRLCQAVRLPLLAFVTASTLALAVCDPGAMPPSDPSAGPTDTKAASRSSNSPGSTTTAATAPDSPSIHSQEGNIVGFIRESPISGARSEAFRAPSGTRLLAFRRAFKQLLTRGATPELVSEFGALNYELSRFQQEGGASFLILQEAAFGNGQGTFVINLEPARDLWLEAPHADSDDGTLRQTAEVLVALGARALLITGSNRCATLAATPCDGTTSVCGGVLRRSDAAHFTQTYFTAAHRALRDTYPSAVAVSVHGMETEGVEAAVISDGTRTPATRGLSLALRDALNARLPSTQRAFSCNAISDKGLFRPLCGTTNVQGRIDNGSADACRLGSTTASGKFLHVEQGAALRPVKGAPAKLDGMLTAALGEVVACTLGGNGQGCMPVAYGR